MHSSFWMTIAAALGCVLLVLTVAACGGGDSTQTATPTAIQTSPTTSGSGSTSSATQTTQATATQAAGTPAAAVDPCTLLTKDEVTAVIGVAAGDGVEATSQAPTFACAWTGVDATTVVYLTLYAGVDAQAAEANFNVLTATSTVVSGIGDKAHWTSRIESIEVLKGPNDMSIEVIDFKAGANPQTEATTLAQKAVARLP